MPKRMVLIARLSGWRPGQTAEVSCGTVKAKGIICERAIHADTNSGPWKTELLCEVIE